MSPKQTFLVRITCSELPILLFDLSRACLRYWWCAPVSRHADHAEDEYCSLEGMGKAVKVLAGVIARLEA